MPSSWAGRSDYYRNCHVEKVHCGLLTRLQCSLRLISKDKAEYKKKLHELEGLCYDVWGSGLVIRYFWKVGSMVRTPDRPDTDTGWRHTYSALLTNALPEELWFDNVQWGTVARSHYITIGSSCLTEQIEPCLAIKTFLLEELLEHYRHKGPAEPQEISEVKPSKREKHSKSGHSEQSLDQEQQTSIETPPPSYNARVGTAL